MPLNITATRDIYSAAALEVKYFRSIKTIHLEITRQGKSLKRNRMAEIPRETQLANKRFEKYAPMQTKRRSATWKFSRVQ